VTVAMGQRTRLGILLGLNLVMITALVVVGFLAHSLGLLAAGADYVTDTASILLGITAVTIRNRVGAHSRAPAWVALLNVSALLVVTGFVIAESVRRLQHGAPEVNGLPVLVVSAIATLVMIGGVLVLGLDAGREDLHMRSVLLDTMADAVASAAVAVAGAVIYLTGRYYWLDPLLAGLIGLVIVAGALRLLRDVVRSLRT
jgi:cobalt-zinc-cadmium efflux system protein